MPMKRWLGKLSRRSPAMESKGQETKKSAVHHILSSGAAWIGTGAPRWTARDMARLAEEGYRKNVIAHRSVRLIAECAASVPWMLYAGDERVSRHPLLDLLARPNPMDGGTELMERLYAFLNIAGDAYLELVPGVDGRPGELHVLRPDRMKIVPGGSGWPRAYRYSVAGRSHDFAVDPVTGASDVLHLKTFNPLDEHYGLSPMEAAAYGIDIHNAAGGWNKALFDNAARPSGALVYEAKDGGSLTDEQFSRLKDELAATYQGAINAGRPLLLEGGLKWQGMSFSPQDMDFINAKHVSAREIAIAFGVPPMLLSIPGDNTYSNYREANRALWRLTLLPLLEKTASALNRWLVSRFGDDLRLTYDRDAIPVLAADRSAEWERIDRARFMTINEKRQALGLSPIEGGDALPSATEPS